MRKYVVIFCSVLLVAMVFFPGCTTQDTGQPVTTPAPWAENVQLPIATPTPQIVYVTVTATVPAQTMDTGPVPSPTSDETVCRGSEQTAAGISITGNVYGYASVPDAGIDEIRFTIGLDPCSPALDLTQLQIVFSTPDAPAVPLRQGTRTSAGIFTTKIGTEKITLLNPGEQVEIAFFVTPVPASTRMNIEIQPPSGATVPFTTTAPARITERNILS